MFSENKNFDCLEKKAFRTNSNGDSLWVFQTWRQTTFNITLSKSGFWQMQCSFQRLEIWWFTYRCRICYTPLIFSRLPFIMENQDFFQPQVSFYLELPPYSGVLAKHLTTLVRWTMTWSLVTTFLLCLCVLKASLLTWHRALWTEFKFVSPFF